MEIFKLFGSIFVDTDEANKSISKTGENAESFASKLGSGINTVAKWGTAVVGGATAATTALVGFASNSAAAADEVDKMSQKIGMSMEGYQEWSYIMGQNGMEIDKMQTGMKTLVANMDSAAGGTESAIEKFKQLGLSVTDETGKLKNQETMMEEVLFALANMENGTEKARLATEMFGKSGSEMMPMLNQGAQAMTDLKDRAHDLGLVMSDETVTAGVQLGDLMDDVKQSVGMLSTKLGTTLFPILIQICEMIIANLPAIQGLFESLGPVIVQLLEGMLPPLIELAASVFPIIVDLITQLMPFIIQIAQGILPIITQLLQTFLPVIMQIAQAVLPVLVELISAFLPILQALMPLIEPIAQLLTALIIPLAEIISQILPPLIGLLTQLIQEIVPPLTVAIQFLSEVLSKTLKNAFESIQPLIKNVMGILKGLITFISGAFSGDWKKAWSGVVDIFKNIFEGMVNLIKTPMNAIISGINAVFSSIGETKIPDWVPGIGGASFKLPQISYLAEGGVITDPTLIGYNPILGKGAVAGEAGHEAIAPIAVLQRYIAEAVESKNAELEKYLRKILEALIKYLPQLSNIQLVTDTGALVGELIPQIDKGMNNVLEKKGRGIV